MRPHEISSFLRRIIRRWFSAPLKSVNFVGVKRRWQQTMLGKTRSEIMSRLSRISLLFILCCLIACTILDILPQSFKSGQYWNSIIVIIASCIIGAWSFILRIARQIDLRRSLRRIPRYYQLGERDMPSSMYRKIIREKTRCDDLFRNQTEFSAIQHPGLQAPREALDFEVMSVETPFWELVDTIPIFVESQMVQAIPDFRCPPGLGLRDYLEMALNHGIIEPSYAEDVRVFTCNYERARFSRRSLTKDELLQLMQEVLKVSQGIRHRDDLTSISPEDRDFIDMQIRQTQSRNSIVTFASLRRPETISTVGSVLFTE